MSPFEYKKTILRVEDVSLKLGENQILSNVNVEVKDVVRPGHTTGQIIGFLAPSGLGKTKFFECLSGIRKPDSGTIQIGEGLEDTRVGKVGVVQQHYPLFMHKTIISNMRVAAKMKYKNKEEREGRITEILTKFKLNDKRHCYPAMLSGGQKQRAAIAQQMLCSNHFLLMDEPFSGLDVNMIKEVSGLIQEVAHMHELNTIIIVSHDIVSTAAISDTLWVMGRDRDKEGDIVPGAKIKYKYNLMERGLAWNSDVKNNSQFRALIKEIEDLYPNL